VDLTGEWAVWTEADGGVAFLVTSGDPDGAAELSSWTVLASGRCAADFGKALRRSRNRRGSGGCLWAGRWAGGHPPHPTTPTVSMALAHSRQ